MSVTRDCKPGCGNMYPYTVADDRLERIKKEKLTVKNFSDAFPSFITGFVHPVCSFEELCVVYLSCFVHSFYSYEELCVA
jgi:hypothetical protein